MIHISNGKINGIRNSIIFLYFELLVLKRKNKIIAAIDALDCKHINYHLYMFLNAICILLFGMLRKFPTHISLLMYSIGVVVVAICATTVFSKVNEVKLSTKEISLSVMPATGLNSLHIGYIMLSRATVLIMIGKIDYFLPPNITLLFDIIYWSYFLFISLDCVLFLYLKNWKEKISKDTN